MNSCQKMQLIIFLMVLLVVQNQYLLDIYKK